MTGNQYRTVEFPGFCGHQWVNFYFADAFTTTARGINNRTEVVGGFNPQDPFEPQHGFLPLRDLPGYLGKLFIRFS